MGPFIVLGLEEMFAKQQRRSSFCDVLGPREAWISGNVRRFLTTINNKRLYIQQFDIIDTLIYYPLPFCSNLLTPTEILRIGLRLPIFLSHNSWDPERSLPEETDTGTTCTVLRQGSQGAALRLFCGWSANCRSLA